MRLTAFQPWSAAMGNTKIRMTLIVVSALATLYLLPLTLFGVLLAFIAFLEWPPQVTFASVAGVAGLIGMIAAWTRILVRGPAFRSSARLRVSTALGLVIGLAVAAIPLSTSGGDVRSVMGAALVATFAVGIFLLGATIGEGAGT